MIGARRLRGIQPSIIREMTRLAYEYDAVNLAQGFPVLEPPPEVLEPVAQRLAGTPG